MKLLRLLSNCAPPPPSRAFLQVMGLALLFQSSGCERTKDAEPSHESDVAEAATDSTKNANAADSSAPDNSQIPGKAAPDRPGAKAAAKIISALPGDDVVQPVVNPKKLKPYAGKTGTVRGVVRATGDPAPLMPEILKKMDADCTDSRVTFGTLFREGPGRQLADVLVAVTAYEGYVPAREVDVKVRAKGCAWPARTIAMTFGQRLSIDGADNRPYVPEILGQPMPAQLFVLPTAPPVELPPKKPGRYKLVDSMRLFNVSELFVLAYSTMDVTDQQGTFEVTGIPVGKVKVNAFLPQTGAVSSQEIVVEADKVTELSFELAFDLQEYEKKEKPVPLDELPAPK
jgi:hypothetical protein